MSAACQSCCTKEKLTEEKAPANPWVFFCCIDSTDRDYDCVVIWLLIRCSCRDPSFSLQIQSFLGSAKLILTLSTTMCSFTHFWHFQTSIFVLASGYLVWLGDKYQGRRFDPYVGHSFKGWTGWSLLVPYNSRYSVMNLTCCDWEVSLQIFDSLLFFSPSLFKGLLYCDVYKKTWQHFDSWCRPH